jgi:spermidine/putrescine-binding protein
MKTIESKMIKHNKKKPRGWADFWRAIYYGIKKPSTNV